MAKEKEKEKENDSKKKKGKNGKSYTRKLMRFSHGNIGGIFKIVIVALIIANVFSFYVFNGQVVTFTSFLEMLSNAPQVNIGLNIQDLAVNLPDWLNWLEIVINPLMRMVGLFAMLVEMAINAITFLGYFIGWFFGVV